MAKSEIDINLTYGSYLDDLVERTFSVKERIWKLSGNCLEYSIDAHSVRYTDTIELSESEIDSIRQFCTEKNLCRSVEKEVGKSSIKEIKYSEIIKGTISCLGDTANILVRSVDFTSMNEDKHGKLLLELEKFLWDAIENHRPREEDGKLDSLSE